MEFLISADLFDNKVRYGNFKQQTKNNNNYKKILVIVDLIIDLV